MAGINTRRRKWTPRTRVYVPDLKDSQSGQICLSGPESHHLRDVLRVAEDDPVTLFDGHGGVCRAKVSEVSKKGVWLAFRRQALMSIPRPIPELVLGIPLPRGSRADWLVEKLTEVGVSRLVWLETAQQARPKPEEASRRMARWQRLALSAAKQCGRDWLLDIEVSGFAAFLEQPADVRLMADFCEAHVSQVLGEVEKAEHVMGLVGPEGGWTDEERQAAEAAGFRAVRLGKYVLRMETAALVLASALAR